MAWETVLYEKIDGNIARITLNRPEKRNAQNEQLLDELEQARHQAEADEDIRVMILAGAGPSFSAGHDMTYDPERSEQRRKAGLEGSYKFEQKYYLDYCHNFRNMRMPTIAQVHGYASAAGLMVASMCDLIVASEDAKFGDPVLRMTPAAVEIPTLPWDIGVRKAKELYFTGDYIDAQEAWRLGLVNHVVSREKLEEEALNLAKRIAQTPPFAVRLVKRSMNRMQDIMGLRDHWDYHFIVHQLSHRSVESTTFWEERQKVQEKGGMKAFLEMRDSSYGGKGS